MAFVKNTTRLEKKKERDERMSVTGCEKNVGTIRFSERVSKIRELPEEDSNV